MGGASHLGDLRLVVQFGVLDRLGEGVLSSSGWMDKMVRSVLWKREAGLLVPCRWNYRGEVGVFAVDVVPGFRLGILFTG